MQENARFSLETQHDGATQATYTQTPALYGELISQRRGEASSFFHFDGLSSTVGLTDADGAETDSYLYHAFGEELAQAGATLNPLRFVGRLGYYDEAMLQLQYVRARWYAPGEGRWLARDAEEADPYAYVDNQPERFADPSGRQRRQPRRPKPPPEPTPPKAKRDPWWRGIWDRILKPIFGAIGIVLGPPVPTPDPSQAVLALLIARNRLTDRYLRCEIDEDEYWRRLKEIDEALAIARKYLPKDC